MNRVILENDVLRVAVYPNRGGKTGSIVFKEKQFELLEQPRGGVCRKRRVKGEYEGEREGKPI